ncbi:MAG TPA: hypothetical protein VLT17_03090 [Gemmatimonadales bacterium]|nr:hypothetical protein [Gemmatimonadales bacterium]
MSNPLGVDDFFVLEAGEYLERLTVLVGGGGVPSAEDLVRYARALRGSALMASQSAIARAAGGFEALVRVYRDGTRNWDAALAATAVSGVHELKTLVGNIRRWTAADTAAAERLAVSLEQAAGLSPVRTSGPTPSPTADAGVRAFVAREGALVASALDQAAQALRADPASRDPLQAVLRRMQPLRGLAALGDLPPLPELLDGVEGALNDLNRGTLAPSTARELFEAGAVAVSRAARDVAQTGRPDPEAPEARRFADLLLRSRSPDVEVVPIESLFFEDRGPGILHRGTAPRPMPGTALPRVELVSRGEHLCQVAAELERAVSLTQRDLQLLSLSADLRGLADGVSGELGNQLRAFSDYARDAISSGRSGRVPHEFAGRLAEAGELLRSWTPGDAEGALLERLTGLARAMLLLGRAAAPTRPAEPEPEPVSAPAGAGAATEFDEDQLPVVPIESLAPEPEPAIAVAAVEVSMVLAEEGADLGGSFMTYARLVAQMGLGEPSLEALAHPVSYPRAAPRATPPRAVPTLAPERPVAPARTPAPVAAPAPAHVAPTPPAPATVTADAGVVEISELCYRGRTALQRAARLKVEIRSALDRDEASILVQPLLDELMDLVELALVED